MCSGKLKKEIAQAGIDDPKKIAENECPTPPPRFFCVRFLGSLFFFVLAIVTLFFYELIKDRSTPVVCLTQPNVTRYWLKRYGHKRPGAWGRYHEAMELFQWI